MSLRPGRKTEFVSIFVKHQQAMQRVDGCNHLELWEDPHNPNEVTTYSIWKSEDALNAYRASQLFRKVWPEVKILFQKPAVVASLKKLC